MKKNRYNKIDKLLELPKEVCSDVPKIIITGFEEVIIENFKGILEYEEFLVRINTHIGIISISGYQLSLENMIDDDIKVRINLTNDGLIERYDMKSEYGNDLFIKYQHKVINN